MIEALPDLVYTCGLSYWVYLPTMTNRRFTPQAELLWNEIPAQARDQILAHLFCVKCRKGVQITLPDRRLFMRPRITH